MEIMAPAAVTLLMVWAGTLVDTFRRREWQVRRLSRRTWIALVALLPPVGSMAWLVAGRPRRRDPLPDQPMHPALYWSLQRTLADDLAAHDAAARDDGNLDDEARDDGALRSV